MEKKLINFIAKFSLVIFSFLIIYYVFVGFKLLPWEGDSLAYHLPIAKLILSGKIVNPALLTYEWPTDFYRLYQPGAIESILSLFVLTKIPVSLFDVLGIVVFFFSMYLLGKTYGLNKDLSIIFASSLGTLHTVTRWILSQTIDIWLAAFFGFALVLLKNPKNTWKYFASLGVALGFLFGGKYTGPAYFLILIVIFGREMFKKINIKNFISFFIPFSILGLFWYIRNYILTGDPYFPQSIPFFKGIPYHVLDYPAGSMLLKYPKVWFDALFSEYTIWSLVLITVPFLIFKFKNKPDVKLLIFSVLSFVIYLFLPSGETPSLITSGFRYTYVAFIPLVLIIFLNAQKYKKELLLSIVALTNMLIMPELSYHPKLLFFLIPIVLLIYKEDLFPRKLKV